MGTMVMQTRRRQVLFLLLLLLALATAAVGLAGPPASPLRPMRRAAVAAAAFQPNLPPAPSPGSSFPDDGEGTERRGQPQQQRRGRPWQQPPHRMQGRKKNAGDSRQQQQRQRQQQQQQQRESPQPSQQQEAKQPKRGGGSSAATTSATTTSSSHNVVDLSRITSVLSRSDKVSVLRTLEGLAESEVAGPMLVTAWDRLAQRTAAAGPRAPHLPPLHLDRAFSLLVERTRRRLPELAPGHLASVAASMAKLRFRPEDAFLAELVAATEAQADAQSFGTAARLAASLARLDFDFEGPTLARLARVMHDRLVAAEVGTLHPESVAMGLWALAVLGALNHNSNSNSSNEDDGPGSGGSGNGSGDLRERLLSAAIARLKHAHAEAIVAGGHGDGRVRNVLVENRAKHLVRICRQLRTALLFLPQPPSQPSQPHEQAQGSGQQQQQQQGDGDGDGGRWPVASAQEELAAGVAAVWRDLVAWLDPVRRSRLQMEVEGTLAAAGGRPAGEWDDGVVTVDIALHPRAEAAAVAPVALEVDGPSHFFVNQPHRPTGDTKIKHQALHVGYPRQWAAIVQVPHFEWPRQERKRLAFLHGKLAQAGLEPSHFLLHAPPASSSSSSSSSDEGTGSGSSGSGGRRGNNGGGGGKGGKGGKGKQGK